MKKIIILALVLGVLGLFLVLGLNNKETEVKKEEKKVTKEKISKSYASVISKNEGSVTLQDSKNIIKEANLNSEVQNGDMLEFVHKKDDKTDEFAGKHKVIAYDDKLPKAWDDEGIFKKYYNKAYEKIQKMSLDEKIAQILLVRYPDSNQAETLKSNKFGGYIFYAKDFKDKNYSDVQEMMNNLQSVSDIPILTAVDEEGGKVIRVSSNPKLSPTPFKSSRELYLEGGFDKIKEDTINKSNLLHDLGINLNLAPVVDVTTNPDDYMYARALGEDSEKTSEYAETVIKASKGLGVTYVLKHFPGYGNNSDTHTGSSVDERSYEDILNNDLPPFQSGIKAGAEAVLVSHNIVNSVDGDNPASLSAKVHNLLRENLGFTGIIITDDLGMGAIDDTKEATVKAILAGNDLIITTDWESSMAGIKEATDNGRISSHLIDKLALRIISWKYYMGILR